MKVVVVMLPDEEQATAGHDAHCDIITSTDDGNISAVDSRLAGQLDFVECMIVYYQGADCYLVVNRVKFQARDLYGSDC